MSNLNFAPKFINSKWFVPEPGNWHLKAGAPDELVKEFNAYMSTEKLDVNRKYENLFDMLEEYAKTQK